MIKTYRRRPKFDDGFNGNPYYQAAMESYQADPYVQQMNARFPEETGIPMTGEYNPYLDARNYETYGDDYVPETLPKEEAAVSPRQVRANTRSATRPVRKPTTAVQDRKAAEKTYNAAVKAADKKAQKEVAAAKKQVAEANSTLKRNGQKTYSLGNITSKNHQLQEVVVTGSARKKTTKGSSRIGGYAGMGGAMWRPGKSQSGRSNDSLKNIVSQIKAFLTTRPNNGRQNSSINGVSYRGSVTK